MDFGGYIRVSSVKGRDPETWHTVPQQRDAIEGWAKANGHRLAIVHEDLDVSGGDGNRRNLLELVERVESGKLAGLAVAKLDRFGRSLKDALVLLERIDAAGGQFVSVRDGFDTGSPYGRLAMNILLSIGQFELERSREQWDEVRARTIERGRHWGPEDTFGYMRQADGVFALHPERAPIAAEMWKRLSAGVGRSEVAAWLVDQGVTTARGGQPTARWVGQLMTNRAYLGEARAGDIVKEGAHPALVSPTDFEKANALTGPRRNRSKENPGLLSGLLRCHACRYAMNRHRSHVRGEHWRCRKNHAGGVCPAPASCMEREVEPLVERIFFDAVGRIQARSAGDSVQLDHLRAERDKNRHALLTYRDDPEVLSVLGSTDFKEGLRVRKLAVELAERELEAELRKRPSGLPDLAELRMLWPEVDVPTRRQMLKAVFDAVIVKKGGHRGRSGSETLARRVWVVPAGTFVPGDLPRSGNSHFHTRPFDDPTGAWVAAV